MPTKSSLLALVFLCFTAAAFAQKEETLLGRRSWGLSGVWGDYKHQYALYGDDPTYNRGGSFGFEFGKSLLVGWGHYEVEDQFDLSNTDKPFNMRWNVAKINYAFMPYKAVHPVIGADFGSGRVDFGPERDRVFVIQPTAGIEINVFRWFRVGLEGGYRLVQDNDLSGITDQQLSGPFGQASLKFGFSWGRYHKRNEDKKG